MLVIPRVSMVEATRPFVFQLFEDALHSLVLDWTGHAALVQYVETMVCGVFEFFGPVGCGLRGRWWKRSHQEDLDAAIERSLGLVLGFLTNKSLAPRAATFMRL
jgi:hypothetical protein